MKHTNSRTAAPAHSNRRQARKLTGLLVTGLLIGGVAACSDDDAGSDGSVAASSNENTAANAPLNTSINLNEVALNPEDGPQGAQFTSQSEELKKQGGLDPSSAELMKEMAGNTTATPPECAGLYFTGGELITAVLDNPDHASAVSYSVGGAGDNAAEPANPLDESAEGEGNISGDEQGTDSGADGTIYSVVLSNSEQTPPLPGSVEDCANFTRSITAMSTERILNLSAKPWDVSVDGADRFLAAEVTLDSATQNGQDSDMPGIGDTTYSITGIANGVYFQVAGQGGSLDQDTVKDLAQKQIDKLRSQG